MDSYFILFALVLAINLMPVFGPPTWSIIVLYGINSDLNAVPMVLVSASAAAVGRLLLGMSFRALGDKVPAAVRRNLASARAAVESRRKAGLAMIGLFALSPLPSAQLFEAAGLARLRLIPFTLAFFAGRTVSYAIYAAGASELRERTLSEVFERALTSPFGIAIQLLAIAGLVTLARVDWSRFVSPAGPIINQAEAAESPIRKTTGAASPGMQLGCSE